MDTHEDLTAQRSASGTAPQPYGPDNPHPLSTMRTELVWEGKYDEYGNRRPASYAGTSMPMQRIETIDEPRARAEAQGGLFDSEKAHLDDFRNLLIWGDNKLAAASLLAEYGGKIDLICIDPPFDVGADFTLSVPIGDGKEEVEKDQSALEMVAYRDMWGRGTDSYLHMMFERLVLMRSLLSEKGSIYVQCDWRMSSALRFLLDEVFGRDRLVNEIVWHYRTFQGQAHNYFPKKHDTIFLYSRGEQFVFNELFDAAFEDTIDSKRWAAYINDDNEIVAGHMPSHDSRFVRYLNAWRREHDREPEPGDVIYEVRGQPIDSVWDMKGLDPKSGERVGYATQKPEHLIERMIKVSSAEGDLVGDFFCGSGTTGVVAERLGRRWIMADLGRFAIHTSRKRLIEVQRTLHEADAVYRAFDVYNLGRYERQWWQKERLAGAAEEHRRVVLEFFRAEPLPNSPSPLLHGRKGGTVCHVDDIDSIFTRSEAADVAAAASEAGMREVACLAWEFEMDLRLECGRLEQELDIAIKLIMIPREIMEKNRKEPPPFLEVATLTAVPKYRSTPGGLQVDIELTSFIPSLAEVPLKELETLRERTVDSGFDFIDFWAVDFDYRPDAPFHHDWQDYRLKRDRSLKTVSEQRHRYPDPGDYVACVKVIDLFGCDTSISIPVTYE